MKQKIFVLVLLFFVETNAIKCYQNQTRITETFQLTAIECSNIGIIKATGCLTYTSFSTGTVTRMCDYANCTENGFNRSNSCYNNAGNATTCCCNSDACNNATTIFSPFSSSNTTTSTPIQNFSPVISVADINKTLPSSFPIFPKITLTSSNNTFFCYHGEGYIGKYNLSMKPIPCPSKKCILFTAFCEEYWATTCYNDHTRTTLFDKFKFAGKLLKTQQFFDVAFCNSTNCNEYIGGDYYNILIPNPIPFYPLSYKNQKHQRPRKRLENAVVFQSEENENISFIGTPETNAEKVWMEFRIFCSPEYSATIYKLKYTFDRKKLTVNESTGIIKHTVFEDLTLKSRTSFSVQINSSVNAYNFYVNENDQKLYFGENSSNCSKMLVYGGKWKSVKAGISNKTDYKSLTFLPSFEPDPSKYSSCMNEDIKAMIPNPNIKYNSTKDQMVIDKNQTIIKVELINPLKPYGLADTEFRKNLCEFSDLVKVQIRLMNGGSSPEFYYFTNIWTRKNYLWSRFVDRESRIEKKCAKFYVGVSEIDNVIFFCDNSTIFTLPIKDSFKMAQYSVQSIKKEFACF